MSQILHEACLHGKHYSLFFQKFKFSGNSSFLFAKSGDSRVQHRWDHIIEVFESFDFSLVRWSWKVLKLSCDIIRLLIFLWLHEGCSRKGETGSKNTDLNGEKGGFQPTLGNNQELLRQQTPERFWRWKPWTCWESLSICAGNLYLSQPLYVCLWKLMTLRTFTVNSLQAGDSLEAGILCH